MTAYICSLCGRRVEAHTNKKVKCKNCDYEWTTMSTKQNVTCPDCLNKTPTEVKGE